jgi:methyl-accepting chemotaxis protein
MKVASKIILNNGILLAVLVGLSLAGQRGAIPLTAIVIIGAAAAGGLSYALVKAVQGPIHRLARALKDFASGEADLTAKIGEAGDDELAEMAKDFNTFVGKLRGLIGGISDIAAHVASTADMLTQGAEESARVTHQMAEAIQQIAAGSQDQSDSASKTATAVDQLGTAISQVAEGTDAQTAGIHESLNVSSQADQSLAEVMGLLERTGIASNKNAEYASRGSQAVSKVLNSMESIKATTGNIAHTIRELDGYSQEIGKIIEVISSIATQTNLLSLNAAIEAARAGEHGKGFAVVSEEVRKLAEDSSRETKAIANLVSSIRQAIQRAVAASEAGAQEVETGSVLAQEASAALAEIAEGAVETERLVLDLSESSTVVSRASASVQEVMKNVVQVAEQNASSAVTMMSSANEVRRLIDSVAAVSEESAAATEEVSASSLEMQSSIQRVYESAQALAELARSLRDMVGKFRLE